MLLRSLSVRARILLVSLLVAAGAVVGPSAALAATDFSVPSSATMANEQVDSWDSTENYVNVEILPLIPTATFSPAVISGSDADDFVIVLDGCASGGPWTGPDGCLIGMEFRPSAAGVRTATLTIEDPSGSSDVTLSGTGTVGTLTADPVGLSLGPQPYYYGTITQTGEIVNQTSSALVTTSYTITGPDAARFSVAWGDNCFAQIVYGGYSCTFGVQFTTDPDHAGTYAASLTIQNDGADGPLTIPLSATTTIGPHLAVASA